MDTQFQPTGPRFGQTARPGPTATVDERVPGWLSDGRYEYVATLGHGGMGRVFLVKDRELLRQVALKIMHPDLASQVDLSERFVEEARAVSSLEHPNIVPLYDMGRNDGGDLYYTMQYVKSITLADVIRLLRKEDAETLQRWPFQKRAQALVDVCNALAFAHQRSILHGDVKPANVLVGEMGKILLTDWGISVTLGSADTPLDGFGTPGYMAPETLTSGVQTEQSEVFALGVLMYEFLSLEHPFAGKSQDATVATLTLDPPAPDAFLKGAQGRVPRELAIICMRCLSRDPEKRFLSVADVGTAIEQYLHGLAPVVCVQTGLKRAIYGLARLADDHGHAMIIGLCILVMVPLVGLFTWWYAQYH